MSHEQKGRKTASKLQPIIEQLDACRNLWDRARGELGEKMRRALAAHVEHVGPEPDIAEALRDSAVDLHESSKLARAIEDLEAARAGADVIIRRLRLLAGR